MTFSPRDWAYAPSERTAQRAATHFAGRGLLNVPSGASPTAFWQAKVWDALGPTLEAAPSTGTFDDIFDQTLSENAKQWGLSPTRANQLFRQGHPFDLPLGANVIPRGLLGSFGR